jgi:hypothetical protein
MYDSVRLATTVWRIRMCCPWKNGACARQCIGLMALWVVCLVISLCGCAHSDVIKG